MSAYIELSVLAKLIKYKSKFVGEIDNQIIENRSYQFNSSMEVLNFLEKKNK